MITCPHCNSSLNLESLTEDAAARHLFGLITQINCGTALIAYLGLFKPTKQALRWSRAVALTDEVLARWRADPRLGAALVKTVEALREKRQAATWKPLGSHAYLASVLEGLPWHSPVALSQGPARKSRDISLTEMLTDTTWAD